MGLVAICTGTSALLLKQKLKKEYFLNIRKERITETWVDSSPKEKPMLALV